METQLPNSITALQPYSGVSEKYRFISTKEVLHALEKDRWAVSTAQQARVRKTEFDGFQKHLIRLRHPSIPEVGQGIVPELIVINSHNRASAFVMMAGLFRKVCLNGIIVAESTFAAIRLTHFGARGEGVLIAARAVAESVPLLGQRVSQWQGLSLTGSQMESYAMAALAIKWDNGEAPVGPRDLLRVRRKDDDKADLWTTFNRVQENLTKGGLAYRLVTGKQKHGHTRAVGSINEQVRVNRKLWALTEHTAGGLH